MLINLLLQLYYYKRLLYQRRKNFVEVNVYYYNNEFNKRFN